MRVTIKHRNYFITRTYNDSRLSITLKDITTSRLDSTLQLNDFYISFSYQGFLRLTWTLHLRKELRAHNEKRAIQRYYR